MKRIISIEIGCCGDCPYYDWKWNKCSKGAKEKGSWKEDFLLDCPLNWKAVCDKSCTN